MQDGDIGVQSLRPWLENIACCAPYSPVMVIGTHFDRCLGSQKDKEELTRYLESQIKKLHFDKKLGAYPTIVNNKCYFIDARNQKNVEDLKRDIYNFVAEFVPSELHDS